MTFIARHVVPEEIDCRAFETLEEVLKFADSVLPFTKETVGNAVLATEETEPRQVHVMFRDVEGIVRHWITQKPDPDADILCGYTTIPGIPMAYPVPADTPGIPMNGCFISNDPTRKVQTCSLKRNHEGDHEMVDKDSLNGLTPDETRIPRS